MSKHVLIAEDDTLLAGMMGKILQKNKVRVTIAHGGQEAIDAMEKEVPDLLLLDVLMPGVDGYAVMKAMKAKKLKCHVIVISNLSDSHTKAKCEDMDIQHYFVKNDLDDDQLWPVIQTYLT